jgi:hypothetical protein
MPALPPGVAVCTASAPAGPLDHLPCGQQISPVRCEQVNPGTSSTDIPVQTGPLLTDSHRPRHRSHQPRHPCRHTGQRYSNGKPQQSEAITITTAAPAGLFFGWKDFYAKDHPMLSAPQKMTRTRSCP